MSMPANGTVIKRISINEQIFDYMKNAILSGAWSVDEKIPSEVELADYFKVSKLTVRVALQQLIAIGVLEKRVGDGTYVKKFDFGGYVQKLSDFYMSPELLDQVCDFRYSIELNCCKLAMNAATKEDFDELKRLLEQYNDALARFPEKPKEELTDNDFERIVDVDFCFHRQICLMSHNKLLLNAFDMAKGPITQYLNIILKKRVNSWIENEKQRPFQNNIHGEIFDTILNKDYKKCEIKYIEMIDRNIDL